MRSSLSCNHCRRSKIKCVNSGQAPCRKCAKSATSGCVLTRPPVPTSRSIVHATVAPSLHPGQQTSVHTSTTVPAQPRPGPVRGPSAGRPKASDQSNNQPTTTGIATPSLNNLSNAVVLQALHIFSNKFPELAFVNIPKFVEDWRASRSKENRALFASILALTRGQIRVLNPPWSASLCDSEQYASIARSVIMEILLDAPSIAVTQALLVLSLYEWGNCSFHKAWMYCGNAIRIMQALHSSRVLAPYLRDGVLLNGERSDWGPVETRTMWACFIMDRMIHSGGYNPSMLPVTGMQKLKVNPPTSSEEFAHGKGISASNVIFTREDSHSTPALHMGHALEVSHAFSGLVGGFEIWSQVMTFLFNDGRRVPGMCSPSNCPWEPNSVWYKLRNQLETWRREQHDRLRYPETSTSAHIVLGNVEVFTCLNLLYYTSKLMLLREYFPFLPVNEAAPNGPIDPPLLEAEAPPEWWAECAKELFQASAMIAQLLEEASDCGAPLMTPFAGFCAFSACFMNTYLLYFPQMNLGRSSGLEALVDLTLGYLQQFSQVWRLGQGWLETLQNVSSLFRQAVTTPRRYQGKSRAQFSVLHQSVHEFRMTQRSEEQLREMEDAEKEGEGYGDHEETSNDPSFHEPPFFNEFTENGDLTADQTGAWGYWWPFGEELNHGAMNDLDTIWPETDVQAGLVRPP